MIDNEDLRLALRVCRDTMPYRRGQILCCLPPDGTPLGSQDLLNLTKIPRSSLEYHLDDLAAIGIVVTESAPPCENKYKLTTLGINSMQRVLTLPM